MKPRWKKPGILRGLISRVCTTWCNLVEQKGNCWALVEEYVLLEYRIFLHTFFNKARYCFIDIFVNIFWNPISLGGGLCSQCPSCSSVSWAAQLKVDSTQSNWSWGLSGFKPWHIKHEPTFMNATITCSLFPLQTITTILGMNGCCVPVLSDSRLSAVSLGKTASAASMPLFIAVWVPLILGTFMKPGLQPIRSPPGNVSSGIDWRGRGVGSRPVSNSTFCSQHVHNMWNVRGSKMLSCSPRFSKLILIYFITMIVSNVE